MRVTAQVPHLLHKLLCVGRQPKSRPQERLEPGHGPPLGLLQRPRDRLEPGLGSGLRLLQLLELILLLLVNLKFSEEVVQT